MEDFQRLGYTREVVACTDELQRWNHPRTRKAELQLAAEVDCSRLKLTTAKQKRKQTCTRIAKPDKEDSAKVGGDVSDVVQSACAASRLTGLALLSGEEPASQATCY